MLKLFGANINHHDIRDTIPEKSEVWEGNYDSNKKYSLFGAVGIQGKSDGSYWLDDTITFVKGDITNPNCLLALKKEFIAYNIPSKVEFYYPEDFPPVRIAKHHYEDILKQKEFEAAIIIKRKANTWHDSDDYLYYIVSPLEGNLYRSYIEHPNNFYIDDEKVSDEEFENRCKEIVLYGDNKFLARKHDSVAEVYGLKEIKLVEEDRLTKEKYVYYGILKKDLEKDFMRITNDKLRLMNHFYKAVLGNYFKKSDWEEMVEELKKPHDPYVVKGTNKPPYFIIKDFIVESSTPSWYQFVLETYFDGKVQDWMLEKM